MSDPLFDQIPSAKDKAKEIKEKYSNSYKEALAHIGRKVAECIKEADSTTIEISLDPFFVKNAAAARSAADDMKLILHSKGWDVSGSVPGGVWVLKPRATR